MKHRAADRIFAISLIPPAAGLLAFIAALLSGTKAAAPVAALGMLCALCALVFFFLKGEMFAEIPRWAATLFVLAALFLFWISSVPPYWRDDLITHMALPRLALMRGTWPFPSFQPSAFTPDLLLPLNLAFVAYGIDWAASYISVFYILAAALLTAHWTAREAGMRWGIFAGAALLTLGVMFRLATASYSDPAVMFFSAAGSLYWHEWLKTPNRSGAVKGGLAFAAGAAIKYNAGLLLTCFLAVMLLAALRRKTVRDWAVAAFAAAGFTLLFCGPWWAAAHIAGAPRTEFRSGYESAPIRERAAFCGEPKMWAAAAPLRLFVSGTEGARCGFDGRLNPFLLLGGLLALWCAPGRAEKRLLFAALGLFMLFAGLLISPVARYLLPLAPALAFLTASAAVSLAAEGRKAAAIALVAVLLAWNAWDLTAAAYRFEGWEYLTGRESREEFVRRAVPAYAVTQWANDHLPPESRVYFAFTGNRVYYSQRDYYYDAFWDGATLIRLFTGGNDAIAIKQSLRQKGITHLVLMNGVMGRFVESNGIVPLYNRFLAAAPGLYAKDGAVLLSLAEK
ncbi:MAG: hypothetical protein HZA03_11800 [Nitrospinae bacterium]|nr:hypothetical protein [Nitrospinota bacterium]